MDFHALRILVRIHETGSLTRAAEQLDLTQSTVSYTLERLRKAFDDPLFVRQGRGLVASERCTAIVPGVRELLDRFEDVIRPTRFDPAESDRVVRICCNYYERHVLLPRLLARIGEQAPHVRVQVLPAGITGHLHLLDDRVDILLSPLTVSNSGLMVRRLFADRYVCLTNAGDPRRERLGLNEFVASRHIVVNYESGWQPFYIAHLQDLGVEFRPAVELPSFGAVKELMKLGGFLITVPYRVVPHFQPECAVVQAPFDVRFDLSLYWAARAHDSPFVRWLIGLVVEVAHEVDGASGR